MNNLALVKNKLPKNLFLLVFCIFFSLLTIFFLSLGQTARWDILEHISMADRFENCGSIYPNSEDEILTGTSVYFPGLSIIVIILKKIIPDSNLIIAMQILACIVIILFFFIQRYISRSFIGNHSFYFFFYSSALSFFFLNSDWLFYATEFKPDTISYCIGCMGIIISGVDKNVNKSKISLFVGILVTGLGILFKQQYIFFLFGLIFFSFINNNKTLKLFAFSSTFVSVIILIGIKFNTNAWFWTVTVLKDDGFVSAKNWLLGHFTLILKYFFLFLILIAFIFLNLLRLPKILNQNNIGKLQKNIWLTIMFSVFIGAILSSLKVGGNAGNTAFGLIVLSPIYVYFMKYLNLKFTIVGVILMMLIMIPRIIISSKKKYDESINLINQSNKLINGNNLKILTGSNLYFIARKFRESKLIPNYWMYSLRDNSDIEKQLEKSTSNKDYDFLIIENWPSNKNFIQKSLKYEILFSNNTGIIAKFKN